MNHKRLRILAMLFLLGSGRVLHAQDAAGQALQFAEWLFEKGDYYRAIGEYRRALFLLGQSPAALWLELRIGQAYLAGERPLAAAERFEVVERESFQPYLSLLGRLGRARAMYLAGRYGQSLALLEQSIGETAIRKWPEIKARAGYLAACAAIRQGKLKAARSFLEGVAGRGPGMEDRALRLLDGLQRAYDMPYRSPAVAGILSLVPGVGHFYLGDYEVGFTALVWNGLFGWAAADTLRRGQWGAGILLGVLELFWYSGTIYGAVAGAHRFNRDARLNYLDELDRNAGLDVQLLPGRLPLESGLR